MAKTLVPTSPLSINEPSMSTINLNVDTGHRPYDGHDQSLGPEQGNGVYGHGHGHGQGHGHRQGPQHPYPTPVSASSFHTPSSAEAGPSRRKSSTMQMEIDGMEHRARELRLDDAADGRVGVEDPREYFT